MTTPRFYTLGEVDAMLADEPDELLPGVLSLATNILYGAPGIGKGRLVAELISAGLRGQAFAGQDWSRKLDQVDILLTDGDALREYRRYLRSAGVTALYDERVNLLLLHGARNELRDTIALAVARKPSLLIVDSSTQAARGDVNQSEDTRRFTELFDPVLEAGVPVLLVHHVAKPVQEGNRRGQTPLGSTQWEAFGRSKLLLRKAYRKEGCDLVVECRPRFTDQWDIHLASADRLSVVRVVTATEKKAAARERSEQTRAEMAQWRAKREAEDAAKEKLNEAVAEFVVDLGPVSQAETHRRLAMEFSDSGKWGPMATGDPGTWKERLKSRRGGTLAKNYVRYDPNAGVWIRR